MQTFIVNVFFDSEAAVWVATGEDFLGLATEAPTLDTLKQRVWDVAPELIEANYGSRVSFDREAIRFRMLPGPPQD